MSIDIAKPARTARLAPIAVSTVASARAHLNRTTGFAYATSAVRTEKTQTTTSPGRDFDARRLTRFAIR